MSCAPSRALDARFTAASGTKDCPCRFPNGNPASPYARPVASVATVSPSRLSVEPGGQATCEVRVRNTGSVVDEFRFEVLGDAAPWTAVTPSPLSLFPNGEGTVTVSFRPPRDAGVPAGPLPVGIRVTSKEDPQHPSVEELTLDVGEIRLATAELIPRTSHGSRRGRHHLAVDNRGNTRMNVTLDAANPDDLAGFAFRPPSLVIEPGTAAFSRLLVVPRHRFWRGADRSIPFTVTVSPEAGEPVRVDGTMLQEPLIPRWLPRALLALAALAALLAIAFFALVRPAIRSEAKNATRDEVAPALKALSDQIAQVAKAQGQSPPPSVTLGGSGNGGAGLLGSQPASGRLQIGDDQQPVSYTVPDGRKLELTDLVLQNPEGDTGVLRVTAGDETLFVVRLENFRDVDYHFVVPIVVGSGKKLTIAVQCQNPDPAKRCSPAALFSGNLVAAG